MIDDDLVCRDEASKKLQTQVIEVIVANNEGIQCILQEAHPLMISKQIVYST